MWKKAFHAVLCWLTISWIPGSTGKTVNNSVVKDNVSAESAPRLYRNVPLGVYASAAPYAAYSFHLPAFIAAPKTAASRIVPVKEQLVLHNVNGYLRDSYGNKFAGTPQSAAYKTAFPQQYLPLQDLPSHLSQPLLAAPQIKQAAPHYFVGSPYRVPSYHVSSHSPVSSFGGYSQPFVFAQNFGGIAQSQAAPAHAEAAPTHGQAAAAQVQGAPAHAQAAPTHTQAITAQQLPSSNKAVYSQPVAQYQNSQNQIKFQRLEHRPEESHAEPAHNAEQVQENKAQLQAAPVKTSLTAVVNGKKTVITLDTKPPVPLLDLSLLEPLTFANPLVPQVQHFLPRINQATYHKLPDFNVNEQKQHKKEIIVQKTKSYDSGNIKGKPKKKAKQPAVQRDNHHKQRPAKPTITVKGTPNSSPEFSYEIKSPNYKETYKEQSVSYNKASTSDPVNYSYNKKTESEPITYSYQKTEQKPPVHYNYVHSSKEPAQIKEVHYHKQEQEPKQLIYTFKPEEQIQEHDEASSHEDDGSSEESDDDASGPPYPQNHYNNQAHYEEAPRPAYNQRSRYESHPKQQHEQLHHIPNEGTRHQKSNDEISHRSNGNLHQAPKEGEHYEQEQERPHHNSQQEEQGEKLAKHVEAQYHEAPEYEENIRILPSQAPSDEFLKQIESYQSPRPVPLSTLEQYQKFVEEQSQTVSTPQPQAVHSSAPIVHEKAKRIIIQEESPDERYSHHEQMKAEMIVNGQGEDNEEDFEKAYKNAAFGFAAFDKKAEDIEKNIYSPNNYGYGSDHANFEVEKTPFQEYQAEGDTYPKTMRAHYKDARDNTKEDYYLDYSVNRPESLADRYQNKANYFKLYKSQKPERYLAADEDKEKKSEKYSVAPSFVYDSAPEKKQNYFAQYKAEPVKYQYSYTKTAPRDNSAHASHARPHQSFKSKTHFVEPQFQYGFEPIGLPRLLDSELAAMASNDSPESEQPGMRKKVYKENWYIKKTTLGSKPS